MRGAGEGLGFMICFKGGPFHDDVGKFPSTEDFGIAGLSESGTDYQEVAAKPPALSARPNTTSLRVIPDLLRRPGMTRLARETCRLPSNPLTVDFCSDRAAAHTLPKPERAHV